MNLLAIKFLFLAFADLEEKTTLEDEIG